MISSTEKDDPSLKAKGRPRRGLPFFLFRVGSHQRKYFMAQFPTFYEWLALKSEGLWMPDKAAVPGMSRINPFPATQKQLGYVTASHGGRLA